LPRGWRIPDTRLLTLTGPGGTGKTRLAVEIAGQTARRFPDGVVFVDLAPLPRPDHVVPAIARALGLRELGGRPVRESVDEWLRPRCVLLLLDNFEHLLPAALELADLLASSPQVSALVTSREALHLRGEQLVLVPPLDLPAGHRQESVEQIAESSAVRFFVERAWHLGVVLQPAKDRENALPTPLPIAKVGPLIVVRGPPTHGKGCIECRRIAAQLPARVGRASAGDYLSSES